VETETGRQQGQAARHQQGAGRALHRAGGDEDGHGRGQSAGGGRHGEADEPNEEDALAAVAVAEGAAQQQQRTQRQQVGVEDPLQTREAAAQAPFDGREGDVDHGAVEQGHAGAEDAGEHQPATGRRPEPDLACALHGHH
jgi:hypothetical protein